MHAGTPAFLGRPPEPNSTPPCEMKQKRKPKVFFKVASQSYTWQVDLMIHQKRNIFVAVEINSRYVIVNPLKKSSKGAAVDWLPYLKKVIAFKTPCYKIICDNQFSISKECQKLCFTYTASELRVRDRPRAPVRGAPDGGRVDLRTHAPLLRALPTFNCGLGFARPMPAREQPTRLR